MTRLFCVFVMAVALLGCSALGAVMPVLVDVIAAVQDGMAILEALEKYVDQWFKAHPDKDKEEKVRRGLAKARSSLHLALRMSKGAEKLDQQKVDEAFQDFKVAYQELLALLGPLGVRSSGPDGAIMAGPVEDKFYVPTPEAMHLKVRGPGGPQ